MRGGALRNRLGVQSYTSTLDAGRQQVRTWQTDYYVWAKMEAIQGRNIFTDLQTTAQVTHRITVRGRHQITPRNRLIADSSGGPRYFEIEAVLPSERTNVSMTIAAKETDQPEDNQPGQD